MCWTSHLIMSGHPPRPAPFRSSADPTARERAGIDSSAWRSKASIAIERALARVRTTTRRRVTDNGRRGLAPWHCCDGRRTQQSYPPGGGTPLIGREGAEDRPAGRAAPLQDDLSLCRHRGGELECGYKLVVTSTVDAYSPPDILPMIVECGRPTVYLERLEQTPPKPTTP